MTDIREFIEARLAEDAYADLISSGGYEPQRWVLGDGSVGCGDAEVKLTVGGDEFVPVRAVSRVVGGAPRDDEDDEVVAWVRTGRGEHRHVVRHDPARVVRDVEAKRRILAVHPLANEPGEPQHCETCRYIADPGDAEIFPEAGYPCPTVRLLALSYADHSDYREEWAL